MRYAWLGRLVRIRIVQFALLGGAIIVAERVHAGDDVIAFTRADLGARLDAEAARKGSGPGGAHASEIDERAIEDEILYREGHKLGFDRDDPIVRQRVVQKTLFLAEELAGAGEPPTEAELRRYFESTRAQWQRPEAIHFVHVFAHDRSALEALAAETRHRVEIGTPTTGLGEASPVAPEVTLEKDRIAATLGSDFAAELGTIPPGNFSGPMHSAFGWHLVRVIERVPGREATFEEARASLVGEYVVKRRQDAIAAFLSRSFRDYRVTIDGERVAALSPSGRLAVRPSASGED